MGGLWVNSSVFSKGELSPELTGRVDLEAYYQGVATADNVLSIPQGGLKKRPGMQYLETVPGDGRLENFSFNVLQNYLFCFTVDLLTIFKDGVQVATVATPWDTITKIREFDYIQSADTVIITHEDVAPQIIQRISDVSWTVGALGIINIPQFDYFDGSSPAATSEIQSINIFGIAQGSTIKLGLEGLLTEDFSYEGSNADMAEAIREQLQSLPNTPSTGITVLFASGTEFDSNFTVTFADASAKDWRLITGFQTQGEVTGNEKINSSRTQTGTSRGEDVWSALRGWPRTCTFHESRLWFGGSKSRPNTIWSSNTNDAFNFDVGRGLDDQAIVATLVTDQINAVNGIISNKSLQIFTSGAEFYVPESPVTPSNIAVKPQTNLGSKRVRPLAVEGVTMFIQRTGKAFYQFQFVDQYQSNEARSLSLLSPHLIDNPIQIASKKGTGVSDATYVYLVNTGGELVVFNTQALEGVQSFTRWNTLGNIQSVAVVDDTLYLLVERIIEGQSVFYVEIENLELNTDSSVIETTNSDTLTGLDHLEGELVDIKADGAAQDAQTVVGGEVTIVRASGGFESQVATVIEAGLHYSPTIKTMPLNVALQTGMTYAQKKRILRCALNIFESIGIIVNGQLISTRTIGQDQFESPEPQTGIHRVFLHGWSIEAQVTITQDVPMPFEILAINLEVKS